MAHQLTDVNEEPSIADSQVAVHLDDPRLDEWREDYDLDMPDWDVVDVDWQRDQARGK